MALKGPRFIAAHEMLDTKASRHAALANQVREDVDATDEANDADSTDILARSRQEPLVHKIAS